MIQNIDISRKAFSICPLLGWVLVSSFVIACSSKPVHNSESDRNQLCRQGDARSCVGEYKQQVQVGHTAEAEKLYTEICGMPKIMCLQVHPEEAIKNIIASDAGEVLFVHDIWQGGVLTKKRIIVYRNVMVAPE